MLHEHACSSTAEAQRKETKLSEIGKAGKETLTRHTDHGQYHLERKWKISYKMYSWIEILRCSAPQNDIVPTREPRLARDSSLRYIQNDTSVIPNRGLSTECEESYRLVGDSSRRSHSAWHAHGMRFFLLAVVRMTYVLFRMDMRNLYICHLERKWEISSLGIFRGYVLNRVVILDRWFFTSLILRSAWHAFQGR